MASAPEYRKSEPYLSMPEACNSKEKVPGELGIWFFLAGDLIVFSVFFILIALGNREAPELFHQSRTELDIRVGIANTLLLLTASWFVALGVEISRKNPAALATRYFSLSIMCGFAFVANKTYEWGIKINDGITPATNEFFMYFFIFTGIHLLHVLVGLGILFGLRGLSRRPVFRERDIRTLETGGVFWHLVDLLWIVLFALIYLL